MVDSNRQSKMCLIAEIDIDDRGLEVLIAWESVGLQGRFELYRLPQPHYTLSHIYKAAPSPYLV